MEADGLLTYKRRVAERVRRVYRAAGAGRWALGEDRKALAELAREILATDEHR